MPGKRDSITTGSALLADAVALTMRRVLRPIAGRGRVQPGPLEQGRRLILVQLDGISRTRLEWAMRAGHMPFLASRLERGGHALASCRSGTPASTPAFQAGLLYGVAPSVPGFVWYDRASAREVRMDRAADAAAVEASLAGHGPGLLRGGTSYFSIFSGGAALPHFCLSGLAGDYAFERLYEDFNGWDTLASGLVHSVTFARILARFGVEVGLGLWEGAKWSATLGRFKHEPRFFLHRLLVGALMRELAVQGLVIDVARGVPIVFCDFVGYDEYAHRRGPESAAAIANLASIDAALAVIFAAADAAPELGYDVFVFSDHGHIATRPFESFTGLSLPEYLALASGGVRVPIALEREGSAVRLAQTRSLRAWLARLPPGVRGLLARRMDRVERDLIGHALGFARTDRVVTAEAGDLAHVYLVGEEEPLDLVALQARHPHVVAALRESRAVGIVAVRGGARGLALVEGVELDLADPKDVARLPHPDPALLATYLQDLLAMRDSGDCIVLGWRGPDQVSIAYAWEFGSHGGVAPEEIETFFVHPRRCRFRFADVVRPDALHRFFSDAYRAPAAASEERAPLRTREATPWSSGS